MLTRRSFLKTAATSCAAVLAPRVLLGGGAAHAAGTDPVLVMLFLRGGADGLNLVVPAGDPRYYEIRPTIAVPPGMELPVDGFFGLHPAFAPLLPRWQSGEMVAIHAAGIDPPTRSHFDAQDFIEYGAPYDKTVREGWLNRYLSAAGLGSPLDAVTIGTRQAKALAGPAKSLAIPSLAGFRMTGGFAASRRAAIEAIHAQSGGALAGVAEDAMSVLDTVNGIDTTSSVAYPTDSFAAGLRDLAALIKADVGVRIGAVDLGGWDHHNGENEALPRNVGSLAGGLAAFADDLGADLGRTVVLVATEFGRRAEQNGGGGSDHGAASAMFGLGGGVQGGQVLLRDGLWPGLLPQQLHNGDLAVTTDFRDVFSEVLDRHMGLADLSSVFPGFTPDASRYPGLLA